MADNITLDPGTGGAVLASDDVSGVHHQRVKIEYGGDDTAIQVTTAAPLPVDLRADNLAGNLDINIAASAATITVDSELTTADLDTSVGSDVRAVVGLVLAESGGGLLVGSANPLPISDAGGAITVDGTVTVNGTVAVGASVTPGTGATDLGKAEDNAHATGDVGVMSLAVRTDTPANRSGLDGDYEPLQVAGGRLWASATIDAPLPAGTNNLGDVDIASIAAGDNNIGNVDIVTVPAPLSTAGGGTEATALRVTIANDSTGVVSVDDNGGALTVDGTVAVSSITTSIVPGTGATNLGKAVDSAAGGTDTGLAPLAVRDDVLATLTPVDGDYVPLRVGSTGALWVQHSGVVSVDDNGGALTVDGTVTAAQATAANLNAQVVGNVAADAADSGNPVGMGAHARQTHPTAVADGDRVRVYADDVGRIVNYPYAPRDRVVHGRVALTTTTETSVLAAAGAGVFLDLVALYLSNESAVETRVDLRPSTAGTIALSLDLAPDGGGAVIHFPVPLPQTIANNPWTVQLSGANSTIYVTALAIQNV